MSLASLALLESSHRRHDEVLASLLEAARRFAAGRPDAADGVAVAAAVDYFERSVPRHFLDEEGSVFPRLSTRRPELSSELALLSAQHPEQIQLQGLVAAAVRQLTASDEAGRPNVGKTLLDAATRLAAAHRAHVEAEDTLFTAAQLSLTAEDDTEIVAEMETRRDRERAPRKTRPKPAASKRRAPAAAKTATKKKPVARAKKNKPAAKPKRKSHRR